MNYAKIRNYDIANGEGIRTSLFVSGCTNHCQGCFNEEAQDFNYGLPYIPETEQTILKQISKPYVAGLSILGGDPLCQNNSGLTLLIELTNAVHDLGKTVWLSYLYSLTASAATKLNLAVAPSSKSSTTLQTRPLVFSK